MSKYFSRVAASFLAGGLAVAALGVGGVAAASRPIPHQRVASASPATLPQTKAAHRAAVWLASQIGAGGYEGPSSSPDLSDTTIAVLALVAAGNEHAVAERALRYLEGHVDAYVTVDGADGPGQLATLILDAHVLHVNPQHFGGTNLVTRLLKTVRTRGVDAGLFGVQAPTYNGAFRQGLALAALASAGVTQSAKVGTAITWLKHQQCSNGGWEAYRSVSTPCAPTDPNTYTGADTNSTALAIEGLEAQHAHMTRSPLGFLSSLQWSDGGWGYYGGSSDPDSTGLVVQALLAMHQSVSAARFQKGTHDPVTSLLSFQLKDGSLYFPEPPAPNTPSALATEQALPALAKKAFPF